MKKIRTTTILTLVFILGASAGSSLAAQQFGVPKICTIDYSGGVTWSSGTPTTREMPHMFDIKIHTLDQALALMNGSEKNELLARVMLRTRLPVVVLEAGQFVAGQTSYESALRVLRESFNNKGFNIGHLLARMSMVSDYGSESFLVCEEAFGLLECNGAGQRLDHNLKTEKFTFTVTGGWETNPAKAVSVFAYGRCSPSTE